jgi:hypothetical protein
MSEFAQIPTHLICRFGELTKTEIVVVSFLYACRNKQTGLCNPSRGAIGRATGISKSHVSPAVRNLDDKGWILEHPDGSFSLLEPGKGVTESVTPQTVTESVTGLPNPQLRVTDSVTKGYENGRRLARKGHQGTS